MASNKLRKEKEEEKKEKKRYDSVTGWCQRRRNIELAFCILSLMKKNWKRVVVIRDLRVNTSPVGSKRRFFVSRHAG